jgi:hypothetical protein
MRPGGFAILLALALSACATPREPPASPSGEPMVRVLVERNGDSWSARYRFAREAPGWAFIRSALIYGQGQAWRPLSWVIATPGLRWERRDGRDVIVAERGNVPREVRIDFRPAPLTLQADYSPALVFTGGTVALFTDHFLAVPIDQAEEAAEAPVQLNFRDRRGQLLHRGVRYDSARFDGEAQTYILFGPAEPLSTEHLTAIVDSALPGWFRDELLTFLPRVLALYGDALGDPALADKPMVMMSWGGAATSGYSQHGSVLPGLIVMQLQGSGMLNPDPGILDSVRWFIAHESAHFWLGQRVRYESARESWMTEGGADLLAVRAVAASDPAYDPLPQLQREVDDCARLSAGRGVAGASERGEHRAYYACGAVFGLVAEAASRQPFSAFVRALIDSNRADGVLTRDEWLAELDRVSRDSTLSRDIRAMLDEGVADPKAAMASLFARAGVPHTIAADGMPRLR